MIADQPFQRGVPLEELAAKDDAVADAMLQRDAPLPAFIMGDRPREWHRRPDDPVWTAIAESHGSQWVQSSKPASSAPSISSARKPVQSTNKSPSIRSPLSSMSAAMLPLSPSSSTSAILPSTPDGAVAFGHLAAGT